MEDSVMTQRFRITVDEGRVSIWLGSANSRTTIVHCANATELWELIHNPKIPDSPKAIRTAEPRRETQAEFIARGGIVEVCRKTLPPKLTPVELKGRAKATAKNKGKKLELTLADLGLLEPMLEQTKTTAVILTDQQPNQLTIIKKEA